MEALREVAVNVRIYLRRIRPIAAAIMVPEPSPFTHSLTAHYWPWIPCTSRTVQEGTKSSLLRPQSLHTAKAMNMYQITTTIHTLQVLSIVPEHHMLIYQTMTTRR